jgi:UDP-glucose 4-epimerase
VTDTDTARIIPNVFRALTGEAPYVTLNGDGSAVRDFVHVLDVAEAVRLSLSAAKPGESTVYNIGSGTGTSMAQVVTTAEAVTGRQVPLKEMPPHHEPETLTADNSLAAQDLGWRPRRSQLTGILADAWNAWNAWNALVGPLRYRSRNGSDGSDRSADTRAQRNHGRDLTVSSAHHRKAT